MEDAGWAPERIRQALDGARARDYTYDSGAVLGSMCTQPHDWALQAFREFATTNLGDPDHFPGTKQLEAEVLEDLEQLTGAQPGAARFLTGGTEANLLACYLARETTGRKTILVSEAGHFSFRKAARLLGMTLQIVPCGEDRRSSPGALAEAANDDTALVVAIAGSTELGLVDDVEAIAELAKNAGAWCHVDAAFGGYVLPFTESKAWRFDAGVDSIALDPHKMGQAVVPAGALVVGNPSAWNRIAVETDYVSTTSQSTLMGTRPGAAVAATWAVHRALGWDGYQEATARCFEVRDHLVAGLASKGVELVAAPELNVVTFHDAEPEATQARLAQAGVRVNIVPRFQAIRIVVGPHVTKAAIDRLLEAL